MEKHRSADWWSIKKNKQMFSVLYSECIMVRSFRQSDKSTSPMSLSCRSVGWVLNWLLDVCFCHVVDTFTVVHFMSHFLFLLCLQVIFPTRRCRQLARCRGFRESSATPTTPASETRHRANHRASSATSTTPCETQFYLSTALHLRLLFWKPLL